MAAGSDATGETVGSRVRDYMTPEPQTLDVENSLLDAVLLLRRAGMRHIPVLEHGRLVGILSDRDVARLAPSFLTPVSQDEYNRVFESTPVGKIMTRHLVTISPEAPLTEAVELLHTNRLGCLLVVENEQLVGIITVSDMLRALRDLICSSPPASTDAA